MSRFSAVRRSGVKWAAAMGIALATVAGAVNPQAAQAATPLQPVLDWTMGDRYRDMDGDGRPDPVTTSQQAQPSHFMVFLNACKSIGVDASRGFLWTINGGTQFRTSGCQYVWHAPGQGTYPVTVSMADAYGNPGTVTRGIVVKDLLVVSIGDSLASGEGNPEVLSSDATRVKWQDKNCHRSSRSGSALAARQLETVDPR